MLVLYPRDFLDGIYSRKFGSYGVLHIVVTVNTLPLFVVVCGSYPMTHDTWKKVEP
jgi:hypothetical protein